MAAPTPSSEPAPAPVDKDDCRQARTSGSTPSSAHGYAPHTFASQPFHMPAATHRHIEHSPSQLHNLIPPRRSSTGNTAVDPRGPVLSAAFGGDLQPGLHYHLPPTTRQFANPAPLGLSAFALTTFVLSLVNLGARGVSKPNIAVPLALGYGGLVQLLAGMWEMAIGNTFGATALSSYGGFWIAYGILLTPAWNILGPGGPYATGSPGNPDLSTMGNAAVGFFLVGWWIFTTIMLLCTLRSTLAFFAMFLTLDLALLMLACGEFALDGGKKEAAARLTQAGGGFGMCAAFLAWYNALAGLADGSNSSFTVPVLHFPWSEKAREANSQARAKSERATV